MASTSSTRKSSQSGSRPSRDSSSNSSTAAPSSVDHTCADRTLWPWITSSPTTVEKSPGRSGATTCNVEPSASTRTPPPARAASSATTSLAVSPSGGASPRSTPRTRTTSARSNSAFHELHAVSPVAIESASVNAASSSRHSTLPTSAATDSAVAGSVRSRLVAAAGSSRWSRTSSTTTCASCGGESHARDDAPRDLDAGVGVVAGKTLAEIVQERAEEEEVGSGDLAGQHARLRHTLEEVPVDGEAVERVALGPAAHGVPLGEVARDHAVAVEALEHRHQGVVRTEQREHGLARVLGPRRARVGTVGTEPDERAATDRRTRVRGLRGDAPRERRVRAHRRVDGQSERAITQDDARRDHVGHGQSIRGAAGPRGTSRPSATHRRWPRRSAGTLPRRGP